MGGDLLFRDDITLISQRIYTGDGEPFEGFVRISAGKIVAVEKSHLGARVPDGVPEAAESASRSALSDAPPGCTSPDAPPGPVTILDVGDNMVIPGLIDLHAHGSGGNSALGGAGALEGMARVLALHGVTAFQPTLGAAPLDEMEAAITAASEYVSFQCTGGSEALGLHLEGPFLSSLFTGAMAKEHVIVTDVSLISRWVELAGGSISRMTLAPELPGALQMIRYLLELGISASMGHTAATYEEAAQGFRAGINIVTHTFNAMRGFHHREPGALGAALVQKGVFRELIADGIHVHPAAMSMLVTSCGVDSVVLVSDAMPATGLPPGQYEFLGRRVTLGADGKVTLEDGTLAGSSVFLLDCLRNMVEIVGVPFAGALRMATVNPAKALGLFDRKGSLAPGKDADVVVLSDDYEVLGCWAKGKEVKNVFRERGGRRDESRIL
ncbi:MAG: N-acetylglucosamine-6-phosphate deacetylase [Firmicutes bacterium]|nr:N-acetylglucosamine-6-phosphate deacetylase [Candidatus Fermentithermobacillaceae bacterium]